MMIDGNFVITFIASFLVWFMVGIGSIFLLKKKSKKFYFFVFFSVIVSWLISEMVKDLFFTVRPFRINGFPPLTITSPQDNSFPSGHSAFSFALATSLFLINKNFGIIMFFLACLVALGRVLGNVHYPIDVLGGAVLGIFVPLFLESLFLGKKK
jgi:undecaprenyl-diphosphatase